MLNAERFKEKILGVVEDDKKYNFAIKDDDPNAIRNCIDDGISCKDCIFTSLKNGKNCLYNRFNWLLSEYKEPAKLTRLEHDILKYLFNDTGYRYIVRDKYYHQGDIFYLYIFKNKPREDSGGWHSNDPYDRSQFYAFNNLFKFIKFEDEEPTSIKDVLENCEVVNDAEE